MVSRKLPFVFAMAVVVASLIAITTMPKSPRLSVAETDDPIYRPAFLLVY